MPKTGGNRMKGDGYQLDKTCIIILAIGIWIFSICTYAYTFKYQKQTTKQLTKISKEIQEIKNLLEADNQIVTLSAYHPKSRGINSDRDPSRTAIMKRPVPGYTLAISDELFDLGWLGKKIYINGWGVGKATDRMKNSVKGKQIDICAPSLTLAKNFGIKTNVQAVVLD